MPCPRHPTEVVVQAARETDVVEEAGSEAASGVGDAGDVVAAPSVRLPEPSAPPAREGEPGTVAGSRWSSFLQVKTLLIRAVPAVALLFGAIALAFPRVWNVTKKFGTSLQKAGGAIMKAGEAAFTVIEGLSDLPDWVWAAAMLLAALIYLLHITIGLDRAWRWLMMTDEDANFAQRRRDREAAEAAAVRSAASRPVTVKTEPMEGDGSRSLEASRA